MKVYKSNKGKSSSSSAFFCLIEYDKKTDTAIGVYFSMAGDTTIETVFDFYNETIDRFSKRQWYKVNENDLIFVKRALFTIVGKLESEIQKRKKKQCEALDLINLFN